MQKLTQINSIIAPLKLDNIDTDMIIPKQFLKTIERSGLGKNLFYEMRYDLNGNKIDDFVLNRDLYKNAQILIAGNNFGCGSSREHAPWALLDFGIRVIIAPSYADIFYNNCFKNGILPISLNSEQIDEIWKKLETDSNLSANVNLAAQTILFSDQTEFSFEIDEFRKKCLIEGLDDISLTLELADKIADFEANQKNKEPWLYGNISE